MATMTVWRFESAGGAENALDLLERMQKEELIQINDAAYVYWVEGKKKPKTEQLRNMTGAGALGGSFWGLLFGLIFFVPLLGLAVGAAMGALAGSMSDVGIDDDFIRKVRDNVTPGTSALFVMTSNEVADKVLEQFRTTGASLISTNLSNEQEARLREAFAEQEERRAFPSPRPDPLGFTRRGRCIWSRPCRKVSNTGLARGRGPVFACKRKGRRMNSVQCTRNGEQRVLAAIWRVYNHDIERPDGGPGRPVGLARNGRGLRPGGAHHRAGRVVHRSRVHRGVRTWR